MNTDRSASTTFRRFAAVVALLVASFAALAQAPTGGPHDFDFEFGSWTAQLRRLADPLSGSSTWIEMSGTSVVRKVWDGRANLGELAVANAENRIEGLSLRLYNPETRQWNVYWANSKNGEITPPLVGGFKDGRGEFYNEDTLRGKKIDVRIVISDITPTSFRLEQAFSADGRKTWEANWVATFTR